MTKEDAKAAQRLYDAAWMRFVHCPPWRWRKRARLLAEANLAWNDFMEAGGF